MKILVIEDDEVTNFLNKRVILGELPDAEVVIARSGSEALEAIDEVLQNKQPLFDFVLVDGSMPIMDGWAFIDVIATKEYQSVQQIPYYLLTSSLIDEDFINTKRRPLITKFYSKPLNAAKLREILQAQSEKKLPV
ncbi:MAG: response regulator [Bacteroidetes bacterium]|nr:MAG: response regulator [Bacteroidota bacterium]